MSRKKQIAFNFACLVRNPKKWQFFAKGIKRAVLNK